MPRETADRDWTLCWAAVSLRGQTVETPSELSPNGKITVKGDDNPVLVEVATGKKLAALLPSWAQGQVTQVSVESRWSPDSHYLAALISYGSKGSTTVVFCLQNHQASLVKFAEPDPETILKDEMGNTYGDSAAGEPLDSVGPWLNDHELKLLYGVQKDSADGTSKCFTVSGTLVLSGDTGHLDSQQRSVYTPQ